MNEPKKKSLTLIQLKVKSDFKIQRKQRILEGIKQPKNMNMFLDASFFGSWVFLVRTTAEIKMNARVLGVCFVLAWHRIASHRINNSVDKLVTYAAFTFNYLVSSCKVSWMQIRESEYWKAAQHLAFLFAFCYLIFQSTTTKRSWNMRRSTTEKKSILNHLGWLFGVAVELLTLTSIKQKINASISIMLSRQVPFLIGLLIPFTRFVMCIYHRCVCWFAVFFPNINIDY